jgi:type II secretory pathway component GspD/PulD (secretin)
MRVCRNRSLFIGVFSLIAVLAGSVRAEGDSEKEIPTSIRQFKIKLQVMEKDELDQIRTIARPVLITTDDVPATITVGSQLPIPGTHQTETVPTGIIARFKVKWLGDEKIRLDVAFESRKAIKSDLDNLMVSARSIRAITEAQTAKTNRYVVSKSDAGEANLWIDVLVDSILVDRSDSESHAEAGETKRAKPANLVTRVYAVPDLVVTSDGKSMKQFNSLVSHTGTSSFKQLTEAICEKIAPNTWESAGGYGRIVPYEATTSLVVLQTPEIHRQVAEYLVKLRQR